MSNSAATYVDSGSLTTHRVTIAAATQEIKVTGTTIAHACMSTDGASR